MTRSSEKRPLTISFETEGDLHEEIKSLVEQINKESAPDSPESNYLIGLNSMYAQFEDSYTKNIKLLERCQDLNAQIIMNTSKIKTILDVTSKDQETMKELKSNYEEASKMVNFAHTAEQRAKEILTTLREKVTTLSDQVQKGEAFSFGEEGSVFEASQDVKNLKKEILNGNNDIADLNNKISSAKTQLKLVQDGTKSLQQEVERLNTQMAMYDKQNDELLVTNETNSNLLTEIKPQIVQQKQDLESRSKKKAENSKNLVQQRHSYYELLGHLTNLKDSSKQIKDKVLRRSKFLADLKSTNSSKQVVLTETSKKIDNRVEQLDKSKKEIKVANKSTQEYEEKLNELSEKSKALSEDKVQARLVGKQLRAKLVDLQFSLLKSDNETIQHNRQITKEKLDLVIQAKRKTEAEKTALDIHGQAITIKAETKGMKSRLETMKEKVLYLYQEVDEKRVEKYQMLARAEMTKESTEITKEQNEQQMEILEEYQNKTLDQVHLIELTREERNTYKRQYETLMKDHDQLKSEFTFLNNEFQEMEAKKEHLKKSIVTTHFDNMDHKTELMSLHILIEKYKKGIQETEKITSRIQAETQTLHFVIQQAQHDRIQLEQERSLLQNNLLMLRNEVVAKMRKYEDTYAEIQNTQAYLKKCSKLFNDKTAEMMKSIDHLKQLQSKTNNLEQKKERLNALEYDMHRMTSEYMIEQQKAVALVHEFSVPRNVHRWHALGAVDPRYVRQLKYRSILSSKIDKCHCMLIELKKERDQLKEELDTLNTKSEINGQLTVAKVQEYMAQYTESIKAKDREIRELRKQVDSNQPDIRNSIKKIDVIREKVTERRGTTALLNTRNKQLIRMQQVQQQIQQGAPIGPDGQPWFLTEAPFYNHFGGGFVSKPENPVNQNNSIDSRKELTIGTITKPLTATRRAQSSMLSPSIKKIARPLKTTYSRAQTRLKVQFQ